MTSKTITYVLRTIRQLQSCNSLAGMSFPKCTRNYHLSVVTPLLSDTQTFRLAIVPSRCVSHDNSQHTEEKTFTSDGVDEPFDDSSAIPDVDHIGPLNEHFSSKTNELASSPTMSFTMIALSKCTTPREVLNVFSSPVYRKDELLEGVTKLWQTFLTRDQNQKLIERDLIVGHPNFCNLSHGIWKIASTLSPEALVRSLYVLVRLKVNQESKLIQDLLLLCQENLSSFNEVEITILANTLEWLNSDRNVNMLKFGLRLLMDLKIEEFNGVVPLLTMMKATGRTASLSLKLKFEKKALQMVDRFNVAQSENLFYILHDINFYSEHLLNACSRKLIDGIDELSYNNIVNLLSCCCKLVYSNESMFTVFGDHIMKTICLWKPQQLATILNYFAHLHFRHVPLLDRYAGILPTLNSLTIWELSDAVKIFSILNHFPEKNEQQFLDTLNVSLQTHMNSFSPTKLLYIVYHLCVIGVYPGVAVNKLLQYKRSFSARELNLLMRICLCMKIDEPFLNSYFPPSLKKVTIKACEDIELFNMYWKDFINNPDLYQQDLKIAYTYHIDFVMAFDTQEKKLIPVGDLQMDNNSENIVRIALLCCMSHSFALGTLHPLGKLAMKIRILESLGFSVVVVPVHRFVRSTEEERVEFIRTMFQELYENQNALEDKGAKEDLQQSPFDT